MELCHFQRGSCLLKRSHWLPFEPASEFRIGYYEDHGGSFRYHFELKLLLYVLGWYRQALAPFGIRAFLCFRKIAASKS
jgi:hypothetical protein